jgi:farnesyl-diphosphate farnesyltransferase
MGLFLQKTNIIRDYREDLDDKRKFWPKEVWSKYANDLSDFADPKNLDQVFPSRIT